MLGNIAQAPVFAPVARPVDLTGSRGRGKARSLRRVASILSTVWEAGREALSAHRAYARLTARGVRHDPALRQAIGLARPSHDAPPNCSDTRDRTAQAPASARIGNLGYVA
jgi:hypothetical protein